MQKSGLARLVPHLGRHARATRWRRMRGRPRVWAHRGASALAPENTLAAFELAKQAGADGIELDVRLGSDGTVVVFHDRDLLRLCERPGCIEELSAVDRKALRVRGEPVPTLGEVFAMLGDLELNVEIKANKPGRMGALVDATAKVIRNSPRPDQVIISSFDPIALLQIHRHLPDLALAFLFGADQALPLRKGWVGRALGASVLHPEHTLCTEATVKVWKAAGMPINAWTVDEDDELRRLAALGIDGVFANDPAHALKILSAA